MQHVADVEKKNRLALVSHSFHPEPYCNTVSGDDLDEDEKSKRKAATNEDDRIKGLKPTRRYLPCHYFDYIYGSSTGA